MAGFQALHNICINMYTFGFCIRHINIYKYILKEIQLRKHEELMKGRKPIDCDLEVSVLSTRPARGNQFIYSINSYMPTSSV